MKKFCKIFCLILAIAIAIAIPIVVFKIYLKFDIASIWGTWGVQDDGETIIKPDAFYYFLLIIYKLSIYLFPVIILFLGLIILNKRNLSGKKKWTYLLDAFGIWYLGLLVAKLVCNEILELDRCFNWTFFNSVEAMQLLVGYISSFILKKNIELNKPFNKDEKKEHI